MSLTPAQQLAKLEQQNCDLRDMVARQHKKYGPLQSANSRHIAFFAHVLSRIEAGATEYGDASFQRQFSAIIEEQQEEASDMLGWYFVLWDKTNKILTKVRRLEGEGLSEAELAKGMTHD